MTPVDYALLAIAAVSGVGALLWTHAAQAHQESKPRRRKPGSRQSAKAQNVAYGPQFYVDQLREQAEQMPHPEVVPHGTPITVHMVQDKVFPIVVSAGRVKPCIYGGGSVSQDMEKSFWVGSQTRNHLGVQIYPVPQSKVRLSTGSSRVTNNDGGAEAQNSQPVKRSRDLANYNPASLRTN